MYLYLWRLLLKIQLFSELNLDIYVGYIMNLYISDYGQHETEGELA